MVFSMFSITLLVIASACVLLGLKLLFRADWFLQFLRGFAGFGLIIIAIVIIMAGLNLAAYAQLKKGQDLATISFVKTNDQLYEATVVNVQSGEEYKFTVEGDLWQVSGRVLQFPGASPFYKLEDIGGRYYALEQQRSSAASVNTLPDTSIGLSLWRLFKGKDVGLISTRLHKSNFLPMADGAVFSVSTGNDELESAPVNDAARSINNEWQ